MALHSSSRRQALLGLAALAALAVPALARAQADDAPRIAAEEAKRLAAKGEAIVVDVRPKMSYDFEHAEGAISIPLDELEGRLKELPRNKLIAAYCT
jgi:predicted sulfurtransferase